MSDGFERTTARVERELDEGLFTRGAQLAVEVDGERVLDLALGDAGTGAPMESDHVFRVYCTIKPITAVAVARLVDQHVLDLDEPLEGRLPHVQALAGGVTLRHVLTHTAGLHTLSGVEMEMVPPEKRRRIVERLVRPPGWRIGIDAAYSEYAGWHILGWLLEDVTGEPLRRHLRTAVLDPLGLASTWIGMTPREYDALLLRLAVNHEMRQLESFPMLFERTKRVCLETNPAHGGYTTARDLARFYTALLDRLGGGGSDALPSAATLQAFCSPARPAVYDEVLDRVCSYGLGFMTALDQHAFGDRCSAESFGHSGNVGASFAFADPERSLAVGIVFNGLGAYDVASLRRRALVNALYADLDDEAPERDESVAHRDGDQTRRTLLGRWRRRGRQ